MGTPVLPQHRVRKRTGHAANERKRLLRLIGHKANGSFKKSKRHKYNAAGRWIDGAFFDSKAEADRYLQLRQMQARGMIDQLERQVPYPCRVNGQLVCTYLADFRYRIKPRQLGQRVIVEEVKGSVLDAYRIKKKLVEALYPIEIMELKVPKRGTIERFAFLTADQFGVPAKGGAQVHVEVGA